MTIPLRFRYRYVSDAKKNEKKIELNELIRIDLWLVCDGIIIWGLERNEISA